jgi:hypothetical protein
MNLFCVYQLPEQILEILYQDLMKKLIRRLLVFIRLRFNEIIRIIIKKKMKRGCEKKPSRRSLAFIRLRFIEIIWIINKKENDPRMQKTSRV